MIDLKDLESKLEILNGYDFEKAERTCRKLGDMTPDIAFSKNFAVQLAARALDCKPEDIKTKGLQEYTLITSTVSNFLFSGLAADNPQDVTTEK